MAQDKMLALRWFDSAVAPLKRYQKPQRAGFVKDRAALLAETTPEQIESAAMLVTPDGPTEGGVLRETGDFAEYPLSMRRGGSQGNVILLVLVATDGRVTEAT